MRLTVIIFSLFFFCCTQKKKNIPVEYKDSIKIIGYHLEKCLPKDSIISVGTSVKYISFDTAFDVQVQINGKDTLLGFGFNCLAAPALIPMVYEANKNTICLFRGYGQHFREFIICHLDSNFITFGSYETALAFDSRNNNVAFRSYDSPDSIYIENVETKKRKSIILPRGLKYKNAFFAKLTKQHLYIKFENGKNINLSIGGN